MYFLNLGVKELKVTAFIKCMSVDDTVPVSAQWFTDVRCSLSFSIELSGMSTVIRVEADDTDTWNLQEKKTLQLLEVLQVSFCYHVYEACHSWSFCIRGGFGDYTAKSCTN